MKRANIFTLILVFVLALFSTKVFSQNASWDYNVVGGPSSQTTLNSPTVINSAQDDDERYFISWPFNFNIYDDPYTTSNGLSMNSNGYIRFDGLVSKNYNVTGNIPSANTGSNQTGQFLSYGGQSDGKITSNIEYEVQGTMPNREFIIQFGYADYYGSSQPYANVEIVFYENTGNIKLDFDVQLTNGSSNVLGINAGDGVFGTSVGSFPTNDTSFLFQTGSTIVDPPSFTISTVRTDEIDLSWALNSSSNDVILVRNTSSTFATPQNGTSYTTGNDISPGLGTVIYQGSATSFTDAGLLDNTQYYYKIWSKSATNIYSAPGKTANSTTLLVNDPTGFSASAASSTSIDLSWTKNTTNDDVIILANSSNTWVNPSDGVNYNVGDNFGSAVYGTVIYKGSLTNFTHSSLSANTTYHYKVWSYDGSLNYSSPGQYQSESTNQISVDPAQNFSAVSTGPTQIDLNWALNAASDNVLIAYNTTNNFADPNDGTNYVVGNQLQSGKGFILYKGNSTAYNHSSLNLNTKYYYKIWSFDGSYIYSNSVLDSATTSSVAPPSSISASVISSAQIDISTAANASNHDVLLAYNTSNTFNDPTNGINYSPTGNSQLPGGNGTIIYTGAAGNFNHTGILDNTQYYYKVFSRNGNVYSTGITDNAQTPLITDPTSFTATAASSTEIDLSWNLNSASDSVIIVKNSFNAFVSPTDGNSYNVGGSILGIGEVIYKGTLSAFTESSLSASTQYFFKIWSYDAALNYSAPGQTANATTTAPNVDPPQSFAAATSSTSQIDLTWALNSASDNVIIAYNTSNNFASPSNGTDYVVGNQIQTGQGFVLYKGSATNFSHTSLNANTQYFYKIWSYDGSFIYSSTGLTDNATTLNVQPPVSISATAVSQTQIDLSWTKNATNDSVLVAYNTTNNFSTPFNGFPYTSGSSLGLYGTVLYVGDATSFSHTSLNHTTKYYYKIFTMEDYTRSFSTGIIDSATTMSPGISTFPFIEDFENADVYSSFPSGCITPWDLNEDWENVNGSGSGDDIDFIAYTGSTSSSQTGPSVDHTLGTSTGKYIYTESSGCYSNTAYLVSPLLNFSALTQPKLDFYYHTYGSATPQGSIAVKISTDGGSTWSSNLWNTNGNNTNAWQFKSISLASYAGMTDIKIRIEVTTGNGFQSDIALDDIKVYQPAPMTITSIDVEQDTTDVVVQGGTNQEVLKINVKTSGNFNAITLNQHNFDITGITSTADVTAAKLYFTGTNPDYDPTNLFGSVSSVSANFNITGSQVLSEGNNYFWLAYDISSSATLGNNVDASLDSIYDVNSNSYAPANGSITGTKTIIGQITIGNASASSTFYGPVYPSYYNGAYEIIYTSAEMGAQKEINFIAFDKASGSNITDQVDNVRVYIKNSTTSTLSTGSYSTSGYTKVYDGPWPNNAVTGWMGVDLSNPFLYDGSSNLHVLVEQDRNNNTWSQYPYWNHSTSSSQSRGDYSWSSSPTSLTVQSSKPDVRMYYFDPTDMSYANSEAIQNVTTDVGVGQTDVEVIGVKVVTNNTGNPLDLTKLSFTTNGTTSASDIDNAKVYYTSGSDVFATTNQFGSTVSSPSGAFDVNGTQSLVAGENYFWLVYDISSSAIVDNYIDATFTSLTVDGTNHTPAVTNPSGNRQIKDYIIITGTPGGSANDQPVHEYYNHAWEAVYLQSEMGSVSKDINKLAFYKASGSNTTNDILNLTIYLKHTSNTSLSSGSYSTSGYTQVYNGNLPNDAQSGWMEVDLDNSFAYNGSDNVQILLVQSQGINMLNEPYWSYKTTTNNRSRSANSYWSVPSNLSANNQLPFIRFAVSDPLNMVYVSSTATQSNTSPATAGISNQEIIGVEVITNNSANPLDISSFKFNTTGTSNTSDISNAKVYYTGTNPNFNTTTQFGSTVSNPSGSFNVTGSQALQQGTNYFWLTYDVAAAATTGNFLDAQCDSVTINGTNYDPTLNNPLGSRTIVGALSGTYFIGTTGADYTTFAAAINDLNNYGVAGPVTFRVFPGTYNEQITLAAYTNASASTDVTFISHTEDSTDVTLTYGSAGFSNNYVVQFTGEYYNFEKIKIESTGSSYGTVVDFSSGASNIKLKGNIITTSSTSFNAIPIDVQNTALDEIDIINNTISGQSYYALYLRGGGLASRITNLEVKNNIISSNRYAIYGYYLDGSVFEGNQITVNSTSGSAYALYMFYAGGNALISKNDIQISSTGSSSYGIYYRQSDGSSSAPIRIYNNFISEDGSSSLFNNYALELNNVSYADVYNNSIALNTNSSSENRTLNLEGATNVNLKNNILYNDGGGYAIYVDNSSSFTSSDYNNFYSDGTLGYYSGSNRSTLAQWRSATSQDANSISMNPNFTSNNDLHITNLSMNDLGTPLSEITDDIDGDLRSPSTPDIGADEFGVDIDMGVIAFNTPVSPVCSGSEAVEVEIKNFGENTINSVDIEWTVNGVSQSTYNWTGSLAKNATDLVTIGNYSFTAGTTYDIVAYTVNPNSSSDQLNINDTSITQITVNPDAFADAGPDATICADGNYTANGSANNYSSLMWTTSGTGTFDNNSILTPTYTPSMADTANGSVYLKLTAISASCSDFSDSLLLTFVSNPSVSFTGLQSTYCPNEAADTLIGTPPGGTFYGSGINGDVFNPSGLAAGNYDIKYVYINGSCSDSMTITTTVHPSVTPTVTGLASGYCATSANDTAIGNPAGGTFSGAVTSTNNLAIIDPSTFSLGTHNLTYTYVDAATSCSFDTTYSFDIYNTPIVSFTGLQSTYCYGADADTLTGSPAGGTFSGTGITGPNNDIFDPVLSGAGTFEITYYYFDPSGCGDSAKQTVTVHPQQTISFTGLNATYCENGVTSTLVGSPAGGTFSGPGITGNTFDPSVAGQGNHTITYTYVNTNGCTLTDNQNVIVNPAPSVTASASPSSITTGQTTTLNGMVSPNTGVYNYSWTPASDVVNPGNMTTLTNPLTTSTTFTLTATDTITGCSSSDMTTVTVGGGTLSVTASATPDTICENDSVQLNALASGGTGTYAYSWTSNPSGFTSSLENPKVAPLVNTTYTVTVTDASGNVSDNIAVVVKSLPIVDIVGMQSDYCSNDASFALNATPFGGSFSGSAVSGGQYDPSIAPLGNDTVFYTYTGLNGCTNIDTQVVNINEAPIANAGFDVTIPSGSDTILYGSATGGNNYKYNWTPLTHLVSSNTQNAITTNLTSSQVFTLTVTDSITNCASNDDVTVTVTSPNLTVSVNADNTNICEGDNVQLTALPSGGTGTYSYQWISNPAGFSSAANNPMVNPLVDTWYILTVNDGNQSAQDSVFITVNSIPNVQLSGLDTSYCESDMPDILSGSPAGGTYSSSSAGLILNAFDPNTAGPGQAIITYTYTNANGCSAFDSDTTTVYPDVIADAGTDTTIDTGHDTILYGGASGGVGPFSFAWAPVSKLINANVQNPTTTILTTTTQYTLTVTDQTSGCFDDDQVTITVQGGTLTSNATATKDTICDGDSTLISALASGGTGAYTYSWTSNPSGYTSTSSSAYVSPSTTTTYTVQVDDGVNTTSSNVTIVVNPLPNVSFSGLASTYCSNDGQVVLNGMPAGGSFAGNGINGNIFDPAGLSGSQPIVYTYTDPTTGCTDADLQFTSVSVSPIADAGSDLTINAGNDTTLIGTATNAGNYKYSWTPATLVLDPDNDTTQTVALTTTQQFTFTVTDSVTGCSDADNMIVNTGNTALSVNASADVSTICEGDSVNLTALATGGSGSYTYTWTSNPAGFSANGNSVYAKPLITTVYKVTVDDGNSTVNTNVTITVNTSPTVLLTGLDSAYCNNAIADTLSGFPASGYYSGTGIFGNVFDPSLAGVGQHIISYTYTNNNNCSATDYDTVNVYSTPLANAGSDVTIDQNHDTILYGSAIGGSGNYTYEWSPASQVINNLAQNATTVPLTTSTIFTLKAEDANTSCYSTDDVIVTVSGGTLSANPFATPDTVCEGTAVQLNSFVTGGNGTYSYIWTSSATAFTSTQANPVDTPSVSTKYYLTISDGSSIYIDSVSVFVSSIPSASIGGVNSSYCSNGTTDTLIGFPSGGVFNGPGMSGNVFDPSVAGVGNHNIVYSYANAYGCQTNTTAVVTVNPIPAADAGSDIVIPCGGPGGLIGSSSVPNMTYSWTPTIGLSAPNSSSTIATPNAPTNYKLTVTDQSTQCSNSDNVFVDILDGPNAIVSNDTLICAGQTVNLTASGGSSYLWSNGVTTSSFSASPTSTTTYHVVVTQGNCSDVDSVTITVNNPSVFLGPDVVLLDTQSIILNAGHGFESYLWSTGDTVQSIKIIPYLNAGLGNNLFSVTVTDVYGCTASDDIQIGFVLNVDDLENDVDVNIYPNPTKGRFILEIEGTNEQNINLRITNVNGQLIQSESLEVRRGMNKFEFDLSTRAKGIYFIEITNDNYNKTEKLVTQ